MIAVLLVALAALLVVVELARHHAAAELLVLLVLLAAIAVVLRWLLRDLAAHTAGFPGATPASGLGLAGRAHRAERT